MSIQIQHRRGTNAEVEAFTGALGEFIYDTDNKRISAHDGSAAGGFPIPNYLDFQKLAFTYGAATGTDALVASPSKNPDALTTGMTVYVKIASTNTAAATLNWGGLGVKNIKKYTAGAKADVDAGDLVASQVVQMYYDGTDWVVAGGLGAGGGTPITSSTFSAVSEVEFVSLFELGKNYTFAFSNLEVSVNGAELHYQLSENGGTSYVTTHNGWAQNVTTESATGVHYGSGSDTQVDLITNMGASANHTHSGWMKMFDPMKTGLFALSTWAFSYTHSSTTAYYANTGGGRLGDLSNGYEPDTIRFYPSSGNFTGTITVFEESIS